MIVDETHLHIPHEELIQLSVGLVMRDTPPDRQTLDYLQNTYQLARERTGENVDRTYEFGIADSKTIRALGRAAEEMAWFTLEMGPKFAPILYEASLELFLQFVEIYANNSDKLTDN